MEEQPKKKVNPIIIAAIVVQIIFIIVAALSIKQILESNQPELKVEVTGLTSEIPGLTENSKDSIEHAVYRAVSDNSPSKNIEKSGVDIREGSLINKYYEDANINYVSFIADVPNASQSYQVAHIWSSDGKNKYVSPDINVAVTCLPKEQLVYGDFECDHKQDDHKKDIVMMIIRAVGGKLDTDSDNDLLLTLEPGTNYDNFKIKINYALCESMCVCKKATEEDKQRALAMYDEFIKGLGYNPEDFDHYFYSCENDAFYLNENNTLIK